VSLAFASTAVWGGEPPFAVSWTNGSEAQRGRSLRAMRLRVTENKNSTSQYEWEIGSGQLTKKAAISLMFKLVTTQFQLNIIRTI
jgi:hypothetical protein